MWGIGKVKWRLYNVKYFLPGPSSLAKSSDLNYPANLFCHCEIINQVGGYHRRSCRVFEEGSHQAKRGRKFPITMSCINGNAQSPTYSALPLCNSLAKIKETKWEQIRHFA